MYCRKCGTLLEDNVKFCKRCGLPIKTGISYKFCKTCGAKHPIDQLICTNCGSRMDEDNSPSGNEIIKTYKNLTYAIGEVTGLSLKLKYGTFVFFNNRLEIYNRSTSDQVVGGMLGGALGGAIVGAIEASKIASGGGAKPTITVPYVNIVKYVPSNVVRNKSIIFYLNDGSVYTLCFGVETNQKEVLSILESVCR